MLSRDREINFMTKLTRHKTFEDLKSTSNSITTNEVKNLQEDLELEAFIKLLKTNQTPEKKKKANP
ncbi:hypothetical protein BH10BAC3_BH10BAC3_34580 [soil metagenome]